MMYRKELSAISGENAEYFRYENWEGYSTTPPYVTEKETLVDDLTQVFTDIEKESLVTFNTQQERPPIVAELAIEWDECLSSEKNCKQYCNGNDDEDYCPFYREHNTCFVSGDTDYYTCTEEEEKTEIIPPELMKVLIKGVPEKINDGTILFTHLKVYNMDTGDILINYDDGVATHSLVVEIDTTEVDATRKLLIQLGLLTTK